MDPESYPSADLITQDAAPDEAAEDLSPVDDEAPPEDDAGEGDDGGEAEAEPEDDPREEARRLRAELDARERSDRERAEREAQEVARRTQQEQQYAEQRRQYDRQVAWQTYQGKKHALAQQRLKDWETAQASGDPQRLWAELSMRRDQEAGAIDWEYHQWREADYQREQYATRQALERASTREYADYVREQFNLPLETLKDIMTYRDGKPVSANDFASRAAEIADRRKDEANRKRQLTRQQREAGRDAVRGRTSAVPGRGQATGASEIEGTIEELRTLFPLRSDLLRAQRRA